MDGASGNREGCPSFFGFVQGAGRDSLMGSNGSSRNKSSSSSEERKLELRLGPPGGEEEFWSMKEHGKVSTGSAPKTHTPTTSGSQKRTAAPVVGWPPIRSSRRNLSSSSSLKPPKSQDVVPSQLFGDKPSESNGNGKFVKINMDGVLIGRKVDLKVYNSYDKLASAVDQLFRGLLAAQRDTSCTGTKTEQEDEKPISGVLDGKGEYTLVYEDNEGDRILVGDVPWEMFVSTVKRLRVLKSSELSAVNFGGNKQEKRSLLAGPSSR